MHEAVLVAAPKLTGKDIRLEALVDEFTALQARAGQKSDKVCEAFLKTIENGYWRPGDFVPTEKEIAAVLPVSLGTVQTALRRLAAEGIVDRTRGLGTTITVPRDPSLDPKHARFFGDDGKTVLRHEIRLVSLAETTDQGAWTAYLGERASYIRIVRHIVVAGEFTVYNEFYLDGPRFRLLLDVAPETLHQVHLRMLLHDRYNCPTLGFTQNIRFYRPPPTVAAIIGCPPDQYAIMHEIMSHSLREMPLSYQQMIIPPNNRILNISGSL